jgi:rare lipoprotein A
MKKLFFYSLVIIFSFTSIRAENGAILVNTVNNNNPPKENAPRALYGTASFYANKFNGRQTANGEIFSQKKLTGASNLLPLNTWVRVTNLENGRSVLVKITDRMHPRMKRVIDLSKAAAQQLAYVGNGLTKVKVEPFGKNKPTS